MSEKKLNGSKWEDVNVLVTGGASFIGSHLVDRLVSLGYQEVITYRFIDDVKQQKVYPNVDALKLNL